ncbi:MAG: hypothetical protein M3119_09825, partial [Verrucomicrobiota bacterium]|nr:hypothetical protein [Verrucomicrobiota bacterium]
MQDNATRWHFNRHEKIALAIGLALVLTFGAYVERKTALRRRPNTDLSVFTRAAWAVRHGENLYNVTESHGWHYGYPPAIAILFTPLAIAPPKSLPPLGPGEKRTEANTPWGYQVSHANSVYGLHQENFPFFCIVALWFAISVALTCLSAHLLACALKEHKWAQG